MSSLPKFEHFQICNKYKHTTASSVRINKWTATTHAAVNYNYAGVLSVFMCSTDQKYLKTSYIKFSVGHKLGCAMTLGLRVPNDIYQLWLRQGCGFHWGQGFLIHLLSWWSTWVRVRDLLQRPVVSWITTENCNWLDVPGFSLFFSFGLFWNNLSSFSAPCILLPIAQRWSRSWLLFSNHKLGWCRLKNGSWPNTGVAYKNFIFVKYVADS